MADIFRPITKGFYTYVDWKENKVSLKEVMSINDYINAMEYNEQLYENYILSKKKN